MFREKEKHPVSPWQPANALGIVSSLSSHSCAGSCLAILVLFLRQLFQVLGCHGDDSCQDR